MRSIETFFELYSKSATNVVWVFHNDTFVKEFLGSNAVVDAVAYMNFEVENFRLLNTELFCVFEPTLKEMGVILLSRIVKITFLKKRGVFADIWDCFKVHHTTRVHYEPSQAD
jgi:hypothetical protein